MISYLWMGLLGYMIGWVVCDSRYTKEINKLKARLAVKNILNE